MKIRFHRQFTKRYRKLPATTQVRVQAIIRLFVRNPFEPRLRNHALVGALSDLRAFSVTADIRIIYQMEDGHAVVLFLDLGTHTQVY